MNCIQNCYPNETTILRITLAVSSYLFLTGLIVTISLYRILPPGVNAISQFINWGYGPMAAGILSLISLAVVKRLFLSHEKVSEKVSLRLPTLTPSDLAQIGNKIFNNETSGKHEMLVFWNPKEEFPSMGIGHFIWLPPNCKISFLSDTFSEFLDFCFLREVVLPTWLQENQKCPWNNRDDFLLTEKREPEQMAELRSFLGTHTDLQAEFILRNFVKSLPKIIEKLPTNWQEEGTEYCNLLLSTPEGCFALIDYNHFKGQGLADCPEYNNQGWGLKQVLIRALERNWQEEPVEVFIDSAKETLANRVKNAPLSKQEIEQSFLAGWYNRLDRYKVAF